MPSFKKIKDTYMTFREPAPVEAFVLTDTPNEAGTDPDYNKNASEEHTIPDTPDEKVNSSLNENINYLRTRFTIPQNSDVIIREFNITVRDESIKSFIVFYDGMVDKVLLDNNILQPLMLLSNLDITDSTKDKKDYISSHLMPHSQVTEAGCFNTIVKAINFGACALFVDGLSTAFVADIKGFEVRKVEKPANELALRGPQEGFTETLRVNVSLIRKRTKDENLICETLEVGERSKTLCSILFIKNITNDSLVEEVRRRISSLKIDCLNDSGELEQLIEDNTFLPIPQAIATERPDRCALALSEGRIVILVDGSPFALIVPTVFSNLIRATEDNYLRYPYTNLLRYIRISGVILALLLPGIYIAITTFHQEMIPTSLLIAIDASREKVPFPSVFEILLMEISFELIREAGVRIPGPLGPTIGIIGALVLGQAAVAANIVSPILIIIVAVTGIGSFAVVDFSLGYAIRILRFFYIFLGAIAGFLGLSTGIFIQGILLVSAKSFGVPMFAPFGPKTTRKNQDNIFAPPIWKRENRPDYFNSKDPKKQGNISRVWFNDNKKGDKNE